MPRRKLRVQEPLEAAVCVAATLYSRIGHKRYVEACPTADMAGVTTRGRQDMWTGLRASTVAEAEDMTDWDLYYVIDMDASTGRSQVRGTGGRWTMKTANVPPYLVKQYTERKERGDDPPVPQRGWWRWPTSSATSAMRRAQPMRTWRHQT
jgi:hypothetical protein